MQLIACSPNTNFTELDRVRSFTANGFTLDAVRSFTLDVVRCGAVRNHAAPYPV